MKKLLQHIAIYCLATTVLVASNGLSIHHLYCYCKGKMVTTLFHPEQSCGVAEHQTKEKACCNGSSCGKMAGKQAHHCSDCTSVFVKLDAKYLPVSFDLKTIGFVASHPLSLALPKLVVFQKNKFHWQQDQSPPPPAGNDLLPWIQSYLC